MKRIVGLIILALIVGNISAQKIDQKNVPAVILNAFQVKFPTADDVDWRLDKGNYRVSFEVNDKDHQVRLDNRGRFVKHEQDLYVSEIPKVVLETIRKKVPFFDVDDADRITEGKKIVYEINFEIDNKDHDFWINERGKLLNYRKELKKSEVPDFIWSYIRNTSGNMDVEHREYTEENGRGVYWIDGDINNMEHDFYFTEKGKLIKYRKELKNSEIPSETKNFIKNKYGNLDVDRAEYNEENGKYIYYLSGEISDKDHEFTIEGKTKILLHKQDLRDSEIPTPVLNAVKTKYGDYDIRDADLREENGKSTYIIRLRKSRNNIYVIFDIHGDVIEER